MQEERDECVGEEELQLLQVIVEVDGEKRVRTGLFYSGFGLLGSAVQPQPGIKQASMEGKWVSLPRQLQLQREVNVDMCSNWAHYSTRFLQAGRSK